MAVWKASEWESPVSGWHCNCVDNLVGSSAAWWHPARILGISPAQFLMILIERYKPDYFSYSEETGFCCWSWKSQVQMRAYKNWINAEARKVNYQI